VLPTEIFVGKNAVVHAGALNEISHCNHSIQFISCSVDPKGVLTHRIKNMSIYKYTSMYKGITHYTRTSDDTPSLITVKIHFLEMVKFGVGDVQVMPFSKKSHVVYSHFTVGRKGIGWKGGTHGLE
jgi:hypothetical protein